MAEVSVFVPAEQPFLDGLRANPIDMQLHLAYADWLAQNGHPDRARLLRAWVDFVKRPVTIAGMDEHFASYNAYSGAFVLEEVDWVDEIERVRPWIPKPVAETIFRLVLNEHFGDEPSVSWTMKVSPCIFDNRWSGTYEGALTATDGTQTTREGTFFLDQVTGNFSGHVRKL